MRNFVIAFIMCLGFSLSSYAQRYTVYKATSYAVANVNTYTHKYTWGEWTKCSVKIVFDLGEDVIYIYSKYPQKYIIMDDAESFTDNSGGKQIRFPVIDQDGDKGTLRLRIERNGNSQLYVDFNDVAWCYNVVKQ